ncbi:MAG: class I SAM-dependent methyltransferase [Anaerolineae bacterium]|nr:class I SAM-dependent methyltransferase [Anaerolineae bacterium]
MRGAIRRLSFRLTCLWFAARDRLTPPGEVLSEASIARGTRVLDFGCGPGSYAIAAAQLVGDEGHVYAADVDPLAVQQVRATAARKGLSNVTAILTDCATGLESDSLDVALLYDTYHDLARPEAVLRELQRVLKPGGLLSFSDHHLPEDEILSRLTDTGLFRFAGKGPKTFTFLAEGQWPTEAG